MERAWNWRIENGPLTTGVAITIFSVWMYFELYIITVS